MTEFADWLRKLPHSEALEVAAWYDVWNDITSLAAQQHGSLMVAKSGCANCASCTNEVCVRERNDAHKAAEAFKEKYDR